MKISGLLILSFAATGLSLPAQAHHGRDFLLVETAHLPEPGSVFGISRQDYIASDEDEIEWSPALLIGITDSIEAELHTHSARPEDESFAYESTAAALHFRFTPRSSAFALGASLEYERAQDDEADDVLTATGIVGYETGSWHYALNLLLEDESNTDETWGYAAGARYDLAGGHALGLEVLGSLDDEGANELMAGYYFEASESFTVNFGIGTGIDNGPDWSVRSALIWRFR